MDIENIVGYVFIIVLVNLCVMGWYALLVCGCQ